MTDSQVWAAVLAPAALALILWGYAIELRLLREDESKIQPPEH